jgi:hypothetical protein
MDARCHHTRPAALAGAEHLAVQRINPSWQP